jgi:flavin reductase (DIM6/NTAB) family NADH-FMN oxidoreductase RutF
MQMDVKSTPVVDVYQMLVGLVTPRPIAWVTTLSKAGIVNLAPFSFFNAFGANPPVVVFSPTLKRDGSKKDTLLNIEANGEFVINASSEKHAELINLSSKMLPIDESELSLTGQSTIASTNIAPPRLADVPFALECRLMQIIPVGHGPISANLVIGEVLMMHVDDVILGENRQPDPRQLKAIARLGGEYWCRTQDLFQMERPN